MTRAPTRGFTLIEIMIVAIVIGLLAALALPTFQNVRRQSQDKAVYNNARLLGAAADQYFLANAVSTVSRTDLVGVQSYVHALPIVAGEVYPTDFTIGSAVTVTGVNGVRTITYAP